MRKQSTACFCGATFWLALYVLSIGILYDQKCDYTEIQEVIGIMVSGHDANSNNISLGHSK